MLEALDADAVRLWSRVAVDLLAEHCAEIDALNVFPVADSDTGSNALTTVRAGADALAAAAPGDARAALDALAGGAARAALGNSGFLLSQVLRGLADAGPADLAAGLARGAALARAAVVTPLEGTVLTVAEAAAAAAAAEPGLTGAVLAAVRGADAALARTPAQLPQLAQAGVVDAGGRALLVLLVALARVVTGEDVAVTPVRVPLRSPDAAPAGAAFGFEVQFDLDAGEAAVGPLRDTLAALGDSVAVVALGAGAWRVHVHADDVGAAIEAGVVAGRPHGISVTRLDPAAPHDHAGAHPADAPGIAVVAVAPGPGLAGLFEDAGVPGVHVVDAGRDDRPGVAEVVAALDALPAREVVLLPNAARVSGVAEGAAAEARRRGARVAVVPTRSPVQALAAVAVHDPARAFDDDVVAMAEAAAATRHAEITVARAEALTAVGICQPGDVLGLIDDEVVDVGRGLLAVAFAVVDRLLGVGAEMMTVLVGDGAPRRAGELVEAHVRGRSPFTDVHVYAAGQADHPLIIGVE